MYEQPIEIFEEQPIVYATFWERFAAAFIDGIIVGTVIALITFMLSGEFMKPSLEMSGLRLIVGVLYSAILNSSSKQATWGKQAMNIKVTNLEGGRISFLNAVGRFFATYVSMITLLIGYLMMLWDEKKQTLHDKMASTLIVKN